jgi:glutaminase
MNKYDFEGALRYVYEKCLPYRGSGKVADYIPELRGVDPNRFGLSLHTCDGHNYFEGDAEVPFSIQSISKVLVLSMVLPRVKQSFERVQVEPSGDPFNSLIQLVSAKKLPPSSKGSPTRTPMTLWSTRTQESPDQKKAGSAFKELLHVSFRTEQYIVST